jgi:hypothetical protein
VHQEEDDVSRNNDNDDGDTYAANARGLGQIERLRAQLGHDARSGNNASVCA